MGGFEQAMYQIFQETTGQETPRCAFADGCVCGPFLALLDMHTTAKLQNLLTFCLRDDCMLC